MKGGMEGTKALLSPSVVLSLCQALDTFQLLEMFPRVANV